VARRGGAAVRCNARGKFPCKIPDGKAEFKHHRSKLHRLMERKNRLARYFVLCRGLGLHLDYLATSDAKSDVILLLLDPDFQ